MPNAKTGKTSTRSIDAGAAAGSPVARVLAGRDAIQDWQETTYRTLHRHPELSNQEVKTARTAADALRGAGYQVHERVGTTGVVGILKNGDGPVVLMRADMDALPVKEQTGLPYASTDHATDASGQVVPVAHACGHDVHVASLMGAARLLAAGTAAWHGTFVALFQPAEELGSGADGMINGGLVSLIPKPDVALAQHVLSYPAGTVGTHAGRFFSTADSLRITVYGRGSHGSMPHLSVDPVLLATMIVVRLQGIVSREVEPGEFAVITVGDIQSGTTSNVIGDHAVLDVNIRTYTQDTRELVLNAIKRIVKGECVASGSPRDPEFELYDSYPLTTNDPDATATVATAFEEYFGRQATTVPRQSASEDFSEIPNALGVPYTYWSLGGIEAKRWHKAEAAGALDTVPVNHSPKFAPVIQPTLQTGTAAIAVAALAWLSS